MIMASNSILAGNDLVGSPVRFDALLRDSPFPPSNAEHWSVGRFKFDFPMNFSFHDFGCLQGNQSINDILEYFREEAAIAG